MRRLDIPGHVQLVGYAMVVMWLVLGMVEWLLFGAPQYAIPDALMAGAAVVFTRSNTKFARVNETLIKANGDLLEALEKQQSLLRASAITAVAAEYASSKN